MSRTTPRSIGMRLLAAVLAATGLVLVSSGLASVRADAAARAAPKITLAVKASPVMSFAPAKIRFVGELKGGPNDNEELYCPSVEWDWNDGTTSESSADCEPYQAGKSQIPRRFTIEHEYTMPGVYRVQLKLKKKSRVIISSSVHVEVNGEPGSPHGLSAPSC